MPDTRGVTMRRRITLHLVASFVGVVLVGEALFALGVHALLAFVALMGCALLAHLTSPRCPRCGTNVYRTTHRFGPGYSPATVRCAGCGVKRSQV